MSSSLAAASASTVGQRVDEALEPRAAPSPPSSAGASPRSATRDRDRAAARRAASATASAGSYPHNVGAGGSAALAVTIFAMACSSADVEEKAGQRGFAAKLPRRAPRASSSATIGGQSFRRFGFVQSSIVSRWGEIVGERYAKVSSPESIRFPAGKKARRRADPAGRRRARAADPASDADDRRAGQPLLRLCGDQPHRVPAGQAARAAAQARAAAAARRCRRNLAKGCARSPIPSFAPVWSCLPRKLPLAAARRRSRRRTTTHTRDQRSELNR